MYSNCASCVIVRLVYRKGTNDMKLVTVTKPNG